MTFKYPFPVSDDLRFDKRVLDHRVRREEVSHEEVKSLLDALEDCAEHAEPVTTVFTDSFARRSDT